MRLASVVVLCGCDGVLGLRASGLADATDGRPSPTCPPIGTAPTFGGQLGAIPARGCDDYSISLATDTAIARCNFTSIASGPIDGPPTVLDLPYPMGPEPKLAPEGNLLFVKYYSATPSQYAIDTLVSAGGSWAYASTYAPLGQLPTISAPSRGPDRRLLVADSQLDVLEELADAGTGAWSMHDQYARASAPLLLPAAIEYVGLSEDGLRAIFSVPSGSFATTDLYYADRQQIADRFGAATKLDVPANLATPYLREDCGRIYFSALDTILYIDQ